jgi:CrcB protein
VTVGLDVRELLAVFAGGFAGAIARLALVEGMASDPGTWPWGTFVANIAGALALGYVAARLHERRPVPSVRLRLLGTGFCGALTTFSTLQLELLRMLDESHIALALSYATVSIAGGVAAVALATRAGRRVSETG